jgi:hypothetical protein
MKNKQASTARLLTRKRLETIEDLVGQLIGVRKEISQGKINEFRVTCGKQGCKCARGEKHLARYLSLSRGGPLKRISVPKKDLPRICERTERYRAFRQLRAQLNKTFKSLMTQIDSLEEALTVPYEKE